MIIGRNGYPAGDAALTPLLETSCQRHDDGRYGRDDSDSGAFK